MSFARWTLFCVTALGMLACGEDVSIIVIDVDLDGYRVPEEIDTLHFELSDSDGVFVERTYELPASETTPSLPLERGIRTPRELTLVIYADHEGALVMQSPPIPLVFEEGEVQHVRVDLSP
ncbi:hypothetical protein ACFL6C_01545 [Myxococcota bacterium]